MNLRSALLAGVVAVPLALAGCSQGGAPSNAPPDAPPANYDQLGRYAVLRDAVRHVDKSHISRQDLLA